MDVDEGGVSKQAIRMQTLACIIIGFVMNLFTLGQSHVWWLYVFPCFGLLGDILAWKKKQEREEAQKRLIESLQITVDQWNNGRR